MQAFRRFPAFLRCWLALCVALAPVLAARAMEMDAPAQATVVADHDMHAGHHAHGEQGKTQADCNTQHDCHGVCCAGCAHCAGVVVSPLESELLHKPVLIPFTSQPLSFAYLPLRERPPRVFSV